MLPTAQQRMMRQQQQQLHYNFQQPTIVAELASHRVPQPLRTNTTIPMIIPSARRLPTRNNHDDAASRKEGRAWRTLSLNTGYAATVVAIVVLVAVSQAVLQRYLTENATDSSAIQLGVKLGTFGQELAKSALMVALTSNPLLTGWDLSTAVDELQDTCDSLTESSTNLQYGDGADNISPIGDNNAFDLLQAQIVLLLGPADALANGVVDSLPIAQDLITDVEKYMTLQQNFVVDLQAQSAQHISRLRDAQWIMAALVLLTVLLQVAFIYRPMQNQLRKQAKELAVAAKLADTYDTHNLSQQAGGGGSNNNTSSNHNHHQQQQQQQQHQLHHHGGANKSHHHDRNGHHSNNSLLQRHASFADGGGETGSATSSSESGGALGADGWVLQSRSRAQLLASAVEELRTAAAKIATSAALAAARSGGGSDNSYNNNNIAPTASTVATTAATIGGPSFGGGGSGVGSSSSVPMLMQDVATECNTIVSLANLMGCFALEIATAAADSIRAQALLHQQQQLQLQASRGGRGGGGGRRGGGEEGDDDLVTTTTTTTTTSDGSEDDDGDDDVAAAERGRGGRGGGAAAATTTSATAATTAPAPVTGWRAALERFPPFQRRRQQERITQQQEMQEMKKTKRKRGGGGATGAAAAAAAVRRGRGDNMSGGEEMMTTAITPPPRHALQRGKRMVSNTDDDDDHSDLMIVLADDAVGTAGGVGVGGGGGSSSPSSSSSSPFQIRTLVQEAVDAVEVECARKKGLLLRYRIDNDVPNSVSIHETVLLRCILHTLLSNAVKYNDNGCVTVQISLADSFATTTTTTTIGGGGDGGATTAAAVAPQMIHVVVSDNGTTTVVGGGGAGGGGLKRPSSSQSMINAAGTVASAASTNMSHGERAWTARFDLSSLVCLAWRLGGDAWVESTPGVATAAAAAASSRTSATITTVMNVSSAFHFTALIGSGAGTDESGADDSGSTNHNNNNNTDHIIHRHRHHHREKRRNSRQKRTSGAMRPTASTAGVAGVAGVAVFPSPSPPLPPPAATTAAGSLSRTSGESLCAGVGDRTGRFLHGSGSGGSGGAGGVGALHSFESPPVPAPAMLLMTTQQEEEEVVVEDWTRAAPAAADGMRRQLPDLQVHRQAAITSSASVDAAAGGAGWGAGWGGGAPAPAPAPARTRTGSNSNSNSNRGLGARVAALGLSLLQGRDEEGDGDDHDHNHQTNNDEEMESANTNKNTYDATSVVNGSSNGGLGGHSISQLSAGSYYDRTHGAGGMVSSYGGQVHPASILLPPIPLTASAVAHANRNNAGAIASVAPVVVVVNTPASVGGDSLPARNSLQSEPSSSYTPKQRTGIDRSRGGGGSSADDMFSEKIRLSMSDQDSQGTSPRSLTMMMQDERSIQDYRDTAVAASSPSSHPRRQLMLAMRKDPEELVWDELEQLRPKGVLVAVRPPPQS